MRIVIAEDESLERMAMKKFIEEHFPSFKVVGEAENGRKAIELAEKAKPDIMLMDIKMPGVSGLEAIETIVKLDPLIKFILVSAYDSFDFAKEAMHFGIKDYILKPGKKEEIIKALKRVSEEIHKEASQELEKEFSISLLKERFIANVMRYPISEETVAMQHRLYPNCGYGSFFAVFDYDKLEMNHVEPALSTLFKDTIIMQDNDQFAVVLAISEQQIENKNLLTIARNMQLAVGKNSFIGIGSQRSIEKLPSSYNEAYAACFQLRSLNKRPYGFQMKGEEREYQYSDIEEICSRIEKGNGQEAILHLKEMKNKFNQSAYETLYFSLRTLLESRNLSFPEKSVSALKSMNDWQVFLERCALEMNELHASKEYIVKAQDYIRSHFHQTITLEDAAEIVNLSPNYFSNIFKQAAGETFMEFLTSVRMERAKKLLESNEYSLKEISFMVGYKNPDYFSRVFKKQFEVSPRHYQREIFEKVRKT